MSLMAQEKKANVKSSKEEGVLLHNGRRFAVGLTWLVADDEIDTKLARERAKKLESDFYALRSTVAVQQGFGFLAMGHRAGMPSAASLASDILVGEWHGVFTADNGWWYTAVHADSIAPDGDIFFFSEEQAFQHFQEQAANYKWPRTYVPESWNLPDASANITLDKLLDDPDRAAVLRPASLDALFGGTKQKSLILVLAGLFLAFLAVAFIAPSLFSSQRPDINDMVRNRLQIPGKIFAPPRVTPENSLDSVDLSGLRGAPPSVLMDSCATTLSNTLRPLPGWDLLGGVCDGSNQGAPNITIMWEKKTGSLNMVKPALRTFPKDVALSFNGTNQITARTGVGNLKSAVRQLELTKREIILGELQKRFSALGQLDIKDVRPPAPPKKEGVEGLIEQEQPPAPAPYLTMSLRTNTPPNMISSYFDLSGLTVESIQWNKRTGVWTYQAEVQYDSKALREYYAYQQRISQKQ